MFLIITCYIVAEKITEGITFVAKQSAPSSVVSLQGVRKAMGVSLDPLPHETVNMDTDQRDIESELSQLLGEDGVSDVMTDIFH